MFVKVIKLNFSQTKITRKEGRKSKTEIRHLSIKDRSG